MNWWQRLRARLRRTPPVDRERFRHDYIGPTTKGGLEHGSPVQIVGQNRINSRGKVERGASGAKRVITQDGRHWLVPPAHLERIS